MEYLNVKENVLMDESILSWEVLSFDPFNPTKLGPNDEIRIALQQTGKYPLPCKSELYLELQVTKEDEKTPLTNTVLINNAPAFLFKELRYILNGVTIDSVRDVGITSTLKGYLSFNQNESTKLENAGWYPKTKSTDKIMTDDKGNVSLCIPLKMYSGFFEDYNKIILNSQQELVLIRSNDDNNALVSTVTDEKPKIKITKLCWRVPHLTVAIPQELALTKLIDKNNDILITFRSWELVEYPELLETTRHNWPVKTSTKIETPRHVLIALQTDRRGNLQSDMSKFDHCELRNINVFLNSERYPYNDLQLNYKANKFATLYEMFSEFRSIYYNSPVEPIFNPKEFKNNAPIVYINCSHQRDLLQTGPVTMRIEFETNEKIPAKTTAYCLIIHDKIFSYNPLTKIVKQL